MRVLRCWSWHNLGRATVQIWKLGILGIILSACVAPKMRDVVPPQLADHARVVGVASADIRMWGDEPPKNLSVMVDKFKRQRRAARARSGRKRQNIHSFLVISGGGSDGAFGAGLLNGWTQAGTRPKFTVVTGVSTGALMAPFVFLGPQYDHILKEFYTSYSTKDIVRPTVLAGLIGGGSSVASSEPLAQLITKYVSMRTLREISAEHAMGRRLLVGTTNLDAERPVIWNLGEIASAGDARALQLVRKILLASASIPGIFPPVLIDVTVKGRIRQEMHVDGGTTDNAILLPMQTNLRMMDRALKVVPKRRLFVIVNSHTNPEWQNVRASTIDIAGRSIQTLIKQQTIGDILKLYEFSRTNGVEFRLAMVPSDFQERRREAFDRRYMTKLFETGEALGRAGYRWKTTPPLR
ncbi:MAG: patatin-like phospholipase family protein [Hyphomicrobiaceae bacterium]